MKILVTGGTGLVGSHIQKLVQTNEEDSNSTNIYKDYEFIFVSSADCDLKDPYKVIQLFKKHKPNSVIHLAARVGGLYRNLSENLEMFSDNIKINENVLEACNFLNIYKAIFCLSSCIFPENPSKFPMDENMIHESPPHTSNEGYAYSKRMLEMQCRQHNKLGYEFICLTPVNLYGPYDNFNLKDSHVIAGIIHRFHNTKINKEKFVMYGSGTPLRQFIYSYDFAKIILKFLFEYKGDITNIICCNDEISIKKLTETISLIYEYKTDKIICDLTKPDGCKRKTVDGSLFKKIFPNFEYTSLENGLKETVDWFTTNYNTCRK